MNNPVVPITSANRLIDNESVYKTIWSRFPFVGFEKQQSFISFWKEWSLKILQLLYTGNVAVVAETGAGKTILAHLVATARFNKILFLVPERILASQHQKLLENITCGGYITHVMLGSTPFRKRKWNLNAQFIFATPQTFVADFNRYKVHMDFDLVIFDEFHHGTGNYDYVKIATLCKAFGVRTLLLSASPGKNQREISAIKKTLWIKYFLYVSNPRQESLRSSYVSFVDLDTNLTLVEKTIRLHMEKILYQIKNALPYARTLVKEFLTQKDLKKIDRLIIQMPASRTKYQLIFLVAVYRKLGNLLRMVLTDTYSVARAYWDNLLKDTSKSAAYIREKQDITATMDFIRSLDDRDHPKVRKLIAIIQAQKLSTRGIVFVNNRQTGFVLRHIMEALGKDTEFLYGKTSIKTQRKVLSNIATGVTDYASATSVIEEGVSVPEIGCVINYSMPLTEKSRIQRMGRTARTTYGDVHYIVLNHPIDKISYFVTARGVKTMREFLGDKKNIFSSPSKRHHRRLTVGDDQLDLFFD